MEVSRSQRSRSDRHNRIHFNTGQTYGAVAINSKLGSLGTDATGTGAHMFGGSSRESQPGQVGYFAIGQADTRLGAPGTQDGNQPGTITSVGQPSGTTQFAFTRLATNVGTPQGAQPTPLNLQGYASAIVQSGSNLYAISSRQLGDVNIQSSAPHTEFSATVRGTPTSVGELSSDPQAAPAPNGRTADQVINFAAGASGPPQSANISPSTFAAAANGRAMASVNEDLLAGIENRTGTITHPRTGQSVNADVPASNEHLAWGWFLGDLTGQAGGQSTDHVNLGFWVAGRQVSTAVMQTLTGTGTYGGALIGTAVEPGRAATVVGQFAQEWNFTKRTGSLNAQFDGRSWTGLPAAMPVGSNAFTGSAMSGNRTLSIQGSFFNNGPLVAPALPAAVGGLFGIRGPNYGANGIMVGGPR